MKYVMLIYQGTALERQAALPEEEQKQVYADYQGLNQTPGVTPGLPMGLPEPGTQAQPKHLQKSRTLGLPPVMPRVVQVRGRHEMRPDGRSPADRSLSIAFRQICAVRPPSSTRA